MILCHIFNSLFLPLHIKNRQASKNKNKHKTERKPNRAQPIMRNDSLFTSYSGRSSDGARF